MAERLRKMFMNDPNFYNPEMMGQEDSQFGEIRGIEPGATFVDRQACAQAGVHPRNYAGIAGSKHGAYSVCLSSGYEDDQDEGEFFVYTGTGGQENSFAAPGKQSHDQTFEHRDNAALYISFDRKKPVRVVRGPNKRSRWATEKGYRYDGLYLVEKAYYDKGKSDYQVCKFELRRIPGQPPIARNPAYEEDLM